MEINDVAGIARLADSKVVQKAYDDVIEPPAKELGKLATDVAKTFRLFTLPFQLAAACQDRFSRWLEQIRNDVPSENQVDAPPEIAGPVFQQMVFLDDGNPITQLYLSLLRRAVDKERQSEVHPAFPAIISQISPDEAMVLYLLATEGKKVIEGGVIGDDGVKEEDFPVERLVYPANFAVYLSHLMSLNLIRRIPESTFRLWDPKKGRPGTEAALSEFGHLFCQACIPANFTVDSQTSDSQPLRTS